MPGLTVPGANSESRPDLEEAAPSAFAMTPSLYSILHSQGLIFSAEKASPGDAGPGNRMLMNPLEHVSWLASLLSSLTK